MALHDYHIKMQEIEELRQAMRLKEINEELLEHLAATLRWLFHYCEKNRIPLPDRDRISRSLEIAMEIADKVSLTIPTKNQQQFTTPHDSTDQKIALADEYTK